MLSDLLLVTNQGLVQVGELTKRKVIDYKLNKRYPRENIVKVKLPPRVISDCYVDIAKLERKKFGELLTYFTRVLESNFFNLDLDYFYNNIKTLDIKELRGKILNNHVLGEYLIDTNEILLYTDCKNTIYHELFHMASSCFRGNTAFSGFSQDDVGIGLDEGYTEFLTRRYFGKSRTFITNYEDQVKLVSFIEKVVGKNKMESLYLKANLKGLLKELRVYLTQDEVVDLVSNIDKLRYLYGVEIKDFSLNLYLDYLRESYLIIFKAFVRKLVREYQQTWLSNVIIDKKVNDFLEGGNIRSYVDGKTYRITGLDDFVNIFQEEFSKIGVYFNESEVRK